MEETDVFLFALEAIPFQNDKETKLHSVQYANWTMSTAEKSYYVGKREVPAIVFALERFCHYILSTEISTLIADHQALRSAIKRKDAHGCVARWFDLLAEYRFEIIYRSGNLNLPADYLSRQCSGRQTEIDMALVASGEE